MENGMYAAVKTDDTVHAVFVDQETLELAHLNRMSKANRQESEQERAEQAATAKKAWRAEEARRRKLHRMVGAAVKQELILGTAMAVVYYGFYAGLVSVFFAIPVLTILLAVACFKAGSFFNRIFRRRR